MLKAILLVKSWFEVCTADCHHGSYTSCSGAKFIYILIFFDKACLLLHPKKKKTKQSTAIDNGT